MPETFTPEVWKNRVAERWQTLARDVPAAMARLGVNTAYGLLTASAFLPLLEAYAPATPGPAIAALSVLTAGVGSNLVANVIQGAYDKANARRIEQEVAEQPALRAEYEAVLGGLDVLRAAQAALGEQWEAFSAQLQAELARMGGGLHIESGGGAVILGNVTVQHGDFVGRDKIEYHFYPTPSPPDVTPQREAYLRHIIERTSQLPLRGVDVRSGDPTHATRPRLAQVYVDLDTTARTSSKDVARVLGGISYTIAQRDEDSQILALTTTGEVGEEYLSALTAIHLNRYVVLLGAPGSGKSTCVNHLAFCLAMHHLEPQNSWLTHLAGWPESETDLLPVLVTLRDFARWAVAQPVTATATVGGFLEHRLAEWDLSDFAAALHAALHQGRAIVFFDGLDEIPTGIQRTVVRDAVADFARTYAKTRIIVTCRTLSYQSPDWQLPKKRFPAFELAPFTEKKIAHFIAAWYAELADLGAVQREDVEGLVAHLQTAVQRPDIARLAPNPLLLTVMALVHAYGGRLPEARALLYEECTDLLLWRWEGSKSEGQTGLRVLLDEAGLQDVDLKRVLWTLAYAAHQGNGAAEETMADIGEETLWKALRQLHPQQSLDWADRVVAQIKERTGLLVEREPGIYTFPHRTFQEYLAGSHLSVQVDFPVQAALLVSKAAFWREVVLLAVGRQVHVMGDVPRPLALAAELCPATCVDDDAGWRRAWLAGEVLHETGVNRVGQSQQGRDLLDRSRERLCALVEGGHLAARERAEAGDLLGQLDDPRFDPECYFLPRTYRGAPEPLWGFIKIPAGRLVLGSRKSEKGAYSDEQPQQTLTIPYDYWVARYPVTVAQFGAFVAAAGYENDGWWTPTGWSWRQGEWDSQVEEDYLKDWLKRRPAALRGAPMWWESQQRYSTRPVTGVSWFEAVAYCRWLGEQLQVAGSKLKVWQAGQVAEVHFQTGTFNVRLPSEAEWEKAARCGDARRYPWGDKNWDEGRANVDRQIGHASPAGLYPRGANPWGQHELAGNVWEWTQTLYQSYPYSEEDGRNAPEAEGSRVLRGGSWLSDARLARCASRDGDVPDNFDNDMGFRVVLSLENSGS